ncbi:vitamin K-dependent gamma-carboxylase-like [Anneissia japonica]|uniref:vitamin K-dependent gamma-carboxylase-like n=1 Tax=Anneissia japonica TaxID=1529436 RepID=UPI0014259B78|nr:vitamin K-dependent gamma-carboxylase-like [Anneissia japonica]
MATQNKVSQDNSDLRFRKHGEILKKVYGSPDDIKVSTSSRNILMPWLWDWLAEPVDAISISLFRVFFGFGMTWHIIRLLRKSTVDANFNFPELNFHYPIARDNVITPRIEVVYAITMAILLSSITMMIGLFTKLSAAVFVTSYVWFNALEKSRYNNHYYFYANLALLIAVTDCGRRFSIDSFLKKSVADTTVPRWQTSIFKFMVVVCYFFAGIAKMNYDWVIRGEPMTMWMSTKIDSQSIIPSTPFVIKCIGYFMSLGGLIFDTFIGILLVSSRFRPFGFFLTMIFHVSNHFLFSIGTFPWVMLTTNFLFVPPESFRNGFRKFLSMVNLKIDTKQQSAIQENIPSTDNTYNTDNKQSKNKSTKFSKPKVSLKIKLFLGCFVGWHLLMPLRHLLYMQHSSVNWTLYGHQFSWRMMLNDEEVLLRLHAKLDVDSEEEFIQDITSTLMNLRQAKRMITDLDLVLQFVNHWTTKSPGSPEAPVSIKAELWKSLNGRPFQRWVDPEVFLSQVDPDDWNQDWILPMVPDDFIDFNELERIELVNTERNIPTSFFMERSYETFATFHHNWSGCQHITVACIRGELFYRLDDGDDEHQIMPGINFPIPLSTKYQLFTKESPAIWMYEHDCDKGLFHHGMDMLSLARLAAEYHIAMRESSKQL